MRLISIAFIFFTSLVSQSVSAYRPFIESNKTAFGEQSVAEITPSVQMHSAYNINTRIAKTRNNGGTSSIEDNKFKVSTGAGANQSSFLFSRKAVKYNAGQGGIVRFTAQFTTGVANSTQWAGVGTVSEGFFFGYSGATFGLLRRDGGSPEIRTLTITTKSTTAENVTITLDGQSVTDVTITDATSGDTTTTANDIAAHDYSDLGGGWEAHAMGNIVHFESFDSAVKTGAYEMTSVATATGTFAQSVAGIVSTDTFIAQSSWSQDTMVDGSGPSGMTLDTTKLNVYSIQYQWLGSGAIFYLIESDSTGRLVLVHRDDYVNRNTVPSVGNPFLPTCMFVGNTSNTSDIVLTSASFLGGTEGKVTGVGLNNSAVIETTGIGTTETPILSIHNHTVYQGKINRIRVKLVNLSVSFDASAANKPAVIRVRKGGVLVGGTFSAVDSNSSVIFKSTTSTSISNGILIFSQGIAEGTSSNLDVSGQDIFIEPKETITISLESSIGTIDPIVTLNWKELF